MLRSARLAFLLTAVPIALCAQASQPVDPLERVYRDIDRLASLGLIDDLVVGQRPFSERQIARLLTEAQGNLARLTSPSATEWAAEVITDDLRRYEPHPARPFDRIDAEQSLLDSPGRPVPSDANGSIVAQINPLAAYREGRPLYDGATTIVESRHSFIAGRHLAVWASPIFTAAMRHEDDGIAKLSLQSGGVRVQFGNFVAQLARDYELFAQSPTAASVLSTNAPPLDALTITNDRPARMPYFGWLGPTRGTVFIADLGEHQQFPHSKLVGWKVSILPHPFLELGASLESETGGNGGPAASFIERSADLFPPINGLRNLLNNGSGNTNFSNKFFGLDARLRVPGAYGLEIFADGAIDDFDTRRLASTFLQDGGIVGGISLSCLVECGRLVVRAEYQQTGIRYYTHPQYAFATDGTLLGDALGPRGLGGYLDIESETNRVGTLAITGAYEVMSGNLYGSSSPSPDDRNFTFVQLQHRAGEHRARALLTWMPSSRAARIGWRTSAGVERVTDVAFVEGRNQTNGLVQIGMEVRP